MLPFMDPRAPAFLFLLGKCVIFVFHKIYDQFDRLESYTVLKPELNNYVQL